MNRIRLSLVDRVWLALGVVLVGMLVVPPHPTAEGLGFRRTLTPEIGPRWRVAQRFRMNAKDLHAIEIRAVAIGAVAGRYRLTLRDRDAPDVERSADVVAATLVRDSSYVFTFAPIEDSADHEYELELTPVPADPGRGVALWATKGSQSEGRGLRINDSPRWASLAFQTHTPAVSFLRAMLGRGDPEHPPRWLGLAGLLSVWMVLRSVLHVVASASENASPTRVPPPVDYTAV